MHPKVKLALIVSSVYIIGVIQGVLYGVHLFVWATICSWAYIQLLAFATKLGKNRKKKKGGGKREERLPDVESGDEGVQDEPVD